MKFRLKIINNLNKSINHHPINYNPFTSLNHKSLAFKKFNFLLNKFCNL